MDIVEATARSGHVLDIVFEDGSNGAVNVGDLVAFDGVFEPLRDDSFFGTAYINADIGTVCWPNGADLDPDVLYSLVTGKPLPVEANVA